MNQQEQMNFVTELAESVAESIVRDIGKGKVPTEWDGVELRQLLADRFKDNTFKMTGKRKAEYNNTVLVNNL